MPPHVVHRFQESIKLEESVKRRVAKKEKVTKSRQVAAEASQAPLQEKDHHDDDATVGGVSSTATATTPSPKGGESRRSSPTVRGGQQQQPQQPQQPPHLDSNPEADNPRVRCIELEKQLSAEKKSNKRYQEELQRAEARIESLEQRLADSEGHLKETILDDPQGEKLQKQRQIVKNLLEELEVGEAERGRLRKKLRASEDTVGELEGEIERLRFRGEGAARESHPHQQQQQQQHQQQQQQDDAELDLDATPTDHVLSASMRQEESSGGRGGRPRKKSATGKNTPMIARRRGGSLLYLVT